MYELVFDAQDLALTRFGVSPMDHLLVVAIAPLRSHYVGGSSQRDRWWRRTRSLVPERARPFLELVGASPDGMPDFLSPDLAGANRRLCDELDALLAVSDDRVRADLARYPADDPPRIVAELRDQGQAGLRRIADAAAALHQACLSADWPRIEQTLQADIRDRTETLARHGLSQVFTDLHPGLYWDGTAATLRYAEPDGFDTTVTRGHLGGQGLQLRPNLFLEHGVGFLCQPGRPAALFHPVAPRHHPSQDRPSPTKDPLAAVLGTARAATLRALASGPHTTTGLATALAITPPAVSARTNALRAAGLITTTRQGQHVQHTLTPLAHHLLETNP